MTDKISGGAFKQMVAFGAACITAQKQAINDLCPTATLAPICP